MKMGCDTAPFIYANNEPKSALVRDLGDCRDNKGKFSSVFSIVYNLLNGDNLSFFFCIHPID